MKRELIALGLMACAAGQVLARETPLAGRKDSRMRTVAYDPAQVVRLSTAVGAALVVSFSPDEKVTAVAVTNSRDLTASPRDNFLFLKSREVLPPEPVIVLTAGPKGARRYVFEVETLPIARLTADRSDIYYSVEFVYPGDASLRRQVKDDQRRAQYVDAHAHRVLETEKTSPHTPGLNWSYVGKGSRALQPQEVFDNGYSTTFRFPGNMRTPAIFRINPSGKESTVGYAVNGRYVTVTGVARGWRLRDGKNMLCLWNQAYDRIGRSPGTGTTSRRVMRITKDSPR